MIRLHRYPIASLWLNLVSVIYVLETVLRVILGHYSYLFPIGCAFVLQLLSR